METLKTVVIALLVIYLAYLAFRNKELSSQNKQLYSDNSELFHKYNKAAWQLDLANSEIKTLNAEYGIKPNKKVNHANTVAKS